MEIALVTATPQTVREGSGTYVAAAALRHGLEVAGHTVRVIAPGRTAGPLRSSVARFRFNRRLAPAAFAGSDVVVGWDMDGYTLAGRLTVPYLAYVHGMLADEARFERGAVGAAMRLQARAERRNVRRADGVLTVSAYSRERIAAVYGVHADRIAVVPPALDVVRWREALARAGPADPATPPTVLAVGRMYPRKDHATLVRAAARLCTGVPRLRVVLAGDGPERGRLMRLVRRLGVGTTVRFAGQLAFDDLARAYRQCDVFCLPSRQEGFGLVFVEALAAGKPVVACRGTAAEELVRDGDTGTLVPPGDDAALATALGAWVTRARGADGPLVDADALVARLTPAAVADRFLAALGGLAPSLAGRG